MDRGRQIVHNSAEEYAMPRDYIPSTDAWKLAFGQNAVNRRRDYQGQMTFVASE